MSDKEQTLHSMDSIPLELIVKKEYRDYQIYTLMDRAIPYLEDGLKPVQRRILFTLWKNQNKGLMKVSAATGLVLTLHPHGPASIESSIVNLAQDFTFTNNYPLIDKKGYFGERMETSPAAARYIECKLGKIAEVLLFDDMNQVIMTPNYDDKVMEPQFLLPKLPIMLLNGAEGIGTGFSSVIPSFDHKDIIRSIINVLDKGKAKKVYPFIRYFNSEISQDDKGRFIFPMKIEAEGEKFFITELPRGYDAAKIYNYLSKHIESGFLKDFIDSSVDNFIRIELVFKKGQTPTFEEIQKTIMTSTSIVPNYTLINERGVRIFEMPEEIINVFTARRLQVIKRRYELLAIEYQNKIIQSNEIIRFIKQKHYEVATKTLNRKDYVEYLKKKEFTYCDYLADMPIYRMTKEEVAKRELMVKEDSIALKEFNAIVKSEERVKKKLVEELEDVDKKLDDIIKGKDAEKLKNYKESQKINKKKK
ncbi:MAG: DNA gyrase subunit A [Bacteriovoracaceae bacterium]